MAALAGDELLDVLLSRRDLVACLTDEPHTKPELVAECGVSRSTIDRGVSTLEQADIVARGANGRYGLTLFGEVAVRAFERSLEHMDTLASVGVHISDLESGGGVDATLFENATIHHSEGISIATTLNVFRDATELRIVNPPLSLVFVGLSPEAEVLSDSDVTALVRSEMLTELAALSSPTTERRLRAGIDLYETQEELPLSFALVDRPSGRSLCLILGNDRHGMAVVETDTDAAVDWGRTRYERLREDATAVQPDPDDCPE